MKIIRDYRGYAFDPSLNFVLMRTGYAGGGPPYKSEQHLFIRGDMGLWL